MRRHFAALLLIAGATFARAAAHDIPPFEGIPVVDTAGILSARARNELNEYLVAASEQTGVQVAVLTVPSLNGETIASYGIAAAEAWGLGQRGADNGVLLTVAMEEHEVRIDVGYGLEEKLTDTVCGLIIRQHIVPAFRSGDYATGIKAGVEKIVAVATDSAPIATDAAPDDGSLADIIIPAIMFAFFFGIVASAQGYGFLAYRLLFALLTGKPARRTIYPRSAPTDGHDPYDSFLNGSGHSRFGGSRGGGNRFGGGGGHFGGGGASGKW
ncbi:MAG: TPM domain-containing protein [Treponemataceae bacterium]|nr:TPM domain-containing protein [Treponemataceae bacterium]